MKLALSFYGSRGDVQPGLCLGHELTRRGHHVTMVIPPNYVGFAESMGLAARPVGVDSEAYWETDRSRELLTTRNPIRKVRLAQQQVSEGFARFDADLADAVTRLAQEMEVDGLVSGPLGQDRIHALAEHVGAPMATMRFCAMSENGAIGAIPTARTLPAAVNRASWRTSDAITWAFTRRQENRFRTRLGLPGADCRLPYRLDRAGVVQLQAYDPVFFPGLADEWGANKPLVGFLDLPDGFRAALGEDVTAHSALWAWLNAGTPPVYVSFGSVPLSDPVAVYEAIATAANALGVRVLVGMRGRPEGIDSSDDALFVADRVDHAAVLPRCRAAVHHGGAGTTAATVRAGLPTMVCWAGADQAHWGAQVTRLGIGTSIRLSRLDSETLNEGLRILIQQAVGERAKAISEQMIDPTAAVTAAAHAIESAFTPMSG